MAKWSDFGIYVGRSEEECKPSVVGEQPERAVSSRVQESNIHSLHHIVNTSMK